MKTAWCPGCSRRRITARSGTTHLIRPHHANANAKKSKPCSGSRTPVDAHQLRDL